MIQNNSVGSHTNSNQYQIKNTTDLQNTSRCPKDQKDNDIRLCPTPAIAHEQNLQHCKTMPLIRKFSDESILDSRLSNVYATKEFPPFRQQSEVESKAKHGERDLLTILEENGGFTINRMESSHDPIVDCLDFKRCCIDDGREQIHLQNMPLFSVYGMSDVM